MTEILRLAAFTDDPAGGNPAGVVLDASALSAVQMLAIAAEVGYSETAFLFPSHDGSHPIRYFSPLAEVPFCGHATIATAVAFAERTGATNLQLSTAAGPVSVTMSDGTATLTSVEPRSEPLADPSALLATLGWTPSDLDPDLPIHVAYAGAFHPVVAVRSRELLAELDYAFDAASALMAEQGWTTLQLIHRADATTFHSRNPFPPGGVVEDPATGAAAAALGGYLRTIGAVEPPATITVHQGVDLGRPSVITVTIPASGGMDVRGGAVTLA